MEITNKTSVMERASGFSAKIAKNMYGGTQTINTVFAGILRSATCKYTEAEQQKEKEILNQRLSDWTTNPDSLRNQFCMDLPQNINKDEEEFHVNTLWKEVSFAHVADTLLVLETILDKFCTPEIKRLLNIPDESTPGLEDTSLSAGRENIKNVLLEVMDRSEFDIPCRFDEENFCIFTPVVQFSEEIDAKNVQLVFRIYDDAFDISIYCADYEPDPSGNRKTYTYMGLVNNIMYPGTSMIYYPRQRFRIYRYVDCCTSDNSSPCPDKIKKNINICLLMYKKFMDYAIYVDSKKISDADAFNTVKKDNYRT